MKKIKRFIAIVLCISLLTSLFTACSSLNLKNNETMITKAEWIENLGRYFGMNEYVDADAHFTDVSIEDSCFPYVQSCYEWNIIPKSKYFNPKEKVTREYAFATCVYALGQEFTEIDPTKSTDKDVAEYAYNNGLAESKSWLYMHEGITSDEAKTVLEKTVSMISNYEFIEYNNSKYAKGVKQLSANEKGTFVYGGKQLMFEGVEASDKYKVGDVLIVKNDEGTEVPSKIKSSKVENGNTYFVLETPDITEIYETLDFSQIANKIDPDKIELADGVTLDSVNNIETSNRLLEAKIVPLGKASDTPEIKEVLHFDETKKIEGPEFNLSLSLGDGFKIKAGSDAGPLSSSTEFDPKGNPINLDKMKSFLDTKSIPEKDFAGLKKLAEKKDKYVSGSFKITGKLSLTNVYAKVHTDGDVGLSWGGVNVDLNKVSAELNMEFKKSISIEGSVKTSIPIIKKIPIQCGNTPFVVNFAVFLNVDFTGKITLSSSVTNNNYIEYSNGKWKKTATKSAQTDVKAELNIDVFIDPRFTLAIGLGWFGEIKIANIDIEIGINFSVSRQWTRLIRTAETTQGTLFRKGGDEDKLTEYQDVSLICTEMKLYLPVIKLSFGTENGTIASKLKIKGTWTLVGKDGLVKLSPVINEHYEEGVGKVDTCTLKGLKTYRDEEEKEDESTTEVNTDADEETTTNTAFQIDSYALDLEENSEGTINIELPKNCSMKDISVSSDDGSVATAAKSDSANSIIVSAHKAGTTTITIKCNGAGEYKCIVMVNKT